ncbi:MAG TPA: DUF1778 domain-containing protein [Chloroflexota bacterium]|nr:DUF1778 domain-containing protein [Chloroflexota bacterium]
MTTTPTTARSERVHARVTPSVKELLRQAAELSGRSLSDFLVSSAQEVAEKTIREHRIITLTAEDSLLFANAILDPAPPNEKLRAAFKKPRLTR